MTELERVRLEIKALEAQLAYLREREAKLQAARPGKWIAPD